MQTIESLELAKLETTPQPAQIEAWVQLAQKKNELTQKLANSELALQKILLDCNVNDYKTIDEALAVYRKSHTSLIETRKEFTIIIDANIVQPLMQFEKRSDPKVNTLYIELTTTSLNLRQVAAKKAHEFQSIENEKNMFTNHCINEFLRIESKYIQDLNAQIDKDYANHLTNNFPVPNFKIIETNLRTVILDAMKKYVPVVITKEQMKELYRQIEQPKYNEILENKISMLSQIFINYATDLANASAAIEARELEAKIAAKEIAHKLEAETAINTLISNASTPIVETPKIKVELKIEVINSPEWAQLIMTHFIANMHTLVKYVRVKTWDNLSIGQMATAIAKHATDTGETYKGIIYNQINK
jgi:hypothetical protein